ncbi:MAG TPA: LamG domain-containing protein, partial [Pirellulales bacterium]|nr:LamG domain-containing protein [Pirellulales bacterium]
MSCFWTASTQRSVRLRRGRRGGLWYSRGRGPKRLRARDMFRQSASRPFERLEPIVLLATDTWTGGAGDGLWATAGNWSNGVPQTTDSVVINEVAPSTPISVTTSSIVEIAGLTVGQGVTLLIDSGLQVDFFSGPGAVIDDGTIQIGDSAHNGNLYLNAAGLGTLQTDANGTAGAVVFGTSSIGANQLVYNGAGLSIASDITVTGGQGEIGGGDLVNDGTIDANASGGTITIDPPSFTNNGTVEATGGGTALVNPTTLTNFSSGTLTGGTWQATGGGTLTLQGDNVATDAARIFVNGTGSSISNGSSDALAGLTAIAGADLLQIQNGYNLTTSGSLDVVGTLSILPGSKLTVSGNYTQGAGGQLSINIDGTTAVTNYGQLAVTGTASLAGTLSANTAGGFNSAPGDTYQPLTAGTVSGTFSTVTASLGDGDTMAPTYSASGVTLTDVPVGTTIFWTGGAGSSDWTTAANWQLVAGGNAVPGVSDNVLIGGNVAVTYTYSSSNPSISAKSLAVQNGASFTYNSPNVDTISGPVSVGVGSTLTLEGSGGLRISPGTIAGPALTVDGTVDLGTSSTSGWLSFDGNQTIAPDPGDTGTILLGSQNNNLALSSGTSLTIAAGITIDGGAGHIGSPSAALDNYGVLNANTAAGQSPGFNVAVGTGANYGTIEATAASAYLDVSGDNWTNAASGVITAASGSYLLLNDTFTNSGTWVNQGRIQATGATVDLGGTITQSDLGTQSVTSSTQTTPGFYRDVTSTVNLTGTITGNLMLSSTSTGAWNLVNGTLKNGAFSTDGVAALIADYGGTLNNVTLDSPIDLTTHSSSLTIENNLQLNTTLDVGNQSSSSTTSQIYFYSTAQTLSTSGGGEIVLGPSGSDEAAIQYGALTVAAGVTILAHGGFIGGGNFTNQGKITADTSGQTVTVQMSGYPNQGQNQGTIQAINGGSLTIYGYNWTNAATGAISITGGGALNLDTYTGDVWTNSGVIQSTGSTINLGGSITQASLGATAVTSSTQTTPGFYRDAASTVNLASGGKLTGNLTLAASTTGNWNLKGGTLSGGAFSTDGTAVLYATAFGGSTLNAETLNSPIDLSTNNGTAISITGGLVLNTTLEVGSASGHYATLYFYGGTLSTTGRGELILDANSANYLAAQTGPVTIGAGVTVLAHGGFIGGGYNALINQGTITADNSSQTVNIDFGNTGQNQGTIQATSGANLTLYGTSWSNAAAGTISISGGGALNLDNNVNDTWSNSGLIQSTGSTVNLGGSITQASLGTTYVSSSAQAAPAFVRDSASTVNLPYNAKLTGNLTLGANTTGNWNLKGGTLSGGTFSTDGAAVLYATGYNSTLNGETLNSPIDFSTYNGAAAVITGGLTLNTTLDVGNAAGTTYGTLTFSVNETLAGNGTVNFGGSASNSIEAGGQTLTIGPTITIQGGSASIIEGTLDNQGAIVASGGGSITVGPSVLSNFASGTLSGGTWKAIGGGVLRLESGSTHADITTNAANIVLDGATSHIYDTTNGTTSALAGLATNASGGSLTVQNGASLSVGAGFTNAGSLTDSSALTVQGASTTVSGVTDHWALDNSTTDSAGSNTLTLHGGAAYASGQIGQALSLTGSNTPANMQYAQAATPILFGTNNFTIGFWLNTTYSGQQAVIGNRITSSGGNFVGLRMTTGKLTAEIDQGSGLTNYAGITGPIVDDGKFHYVSVVRSGTTLSLYVDGQLAGSASSAATANLNASQSFNIGAEPAVGTQSFTGLIDDVQVYNGTALSLTQVQSIYTAGEGSFTQSGGTTTLSGTVAAGTGSGAVGIQGGSLIGTGTVQGNLTNAANVSVSPGALAVTGSYTQTAAGALNVTIDGTQAATSPGYGQLQVTGAATLAGTLAASEINSFPSAGGDTYQPLTAGSISGTFSTVPASFPDGDNASTSYSTTAVTLTDVVPYPAGTTIYWTGGAGDGNWNTAGNWQRVNSDSNPLPDANDTVYIGASANVTLGSGSDTLTSLDVASGATLTVDGGASLATTSANANAGTIDVTGAGSSLSLVLSTNSGAIDDAGGATLTLTGSGWTNTGTITVTGSTVNLGGSFTQAGLGTFTPDSASTVNLTGTLSGNLALTSSTGSWNLLGGTLAVDGGGNGTLTTSGGAVLIATTSRGNLSGGYTLDGTLDMQSIYGAALTVSGGLTLNTTLNIGNAAGNTYGVLIFNGDQSLAATSGDTGQIILGTDNNVVGGSGSLTIASSITISGGDGSIGTGGGIVNYGEILATSSSVLLNIGSLMNYGTIDAESGSHVVINAFTNEAGGTINATSADHLTLGTYANAWSNLGAIDLTDTEALLGGQFTQAGWGNLTVDGNSSLVLVGTLTGGLTLSDSIGQIWLDNGGVISGGDISEATGSSNPLNVEGVNGTLSNVTVDAPIAIDGGNTLNLSGTIKLDTELDLGNATGTTNAHLIFTGPTTLTSDSTASIVLGPDTSESNIGRAGSSGTLTIGPGITISGGYGDIGATPGVTIINQGTIVSSGAGSNLGVGFGSGGSNSGTIEASAGGKVELSEYNGSGNWTNTGTVDADGGSVTVDNLGNFSGGTLTGGTWQVMGGGTLDLDGDNVTTNAANLVIDGATSAVTNDTAGDRALAGVANNASGGSLTIQNGYNLTTTAGTLTNSGAVTAGPSSTLAGPAGFSYTQTAGSTTLAGGTLDPSITPNSVNITGGTLAGYGTIVGNVTNSGTFYPGGQAAAGTVTITGNYTQTSSGTLALDIGGTTAGTGYDQVNVSATANLAGTLDVGTLGGFSPGLGDDFQVLSFASQNGNFAAENGVLPQFDPAFSTDALTLDTAAVVTTTADSGPGSLRQAISDVNSANAAQAAITFDIPTSDPGYNATTGVWTISPASALPTITAPVILDGTSQPGYAGTPVILLDGANAGNSGIHGLNMTA